MCDSYPLMAWMWCIAANLVSQWAFLDIAVRDVESQSAHPRLRSAV
jgi:hypothetical protein